MWDGCFQFVCLWLCLFVNRITSKWLNIGWWNLVVRCIVQKSCHSSNSGVIGPTPGSPHPKCGILLSRYTKVNKAMCFSKYVNNCVIRRLHRWENQHMLSSLVPYFPPRFQSVSSWLQMEKYVTCSLWQESLSYSSVHPFVIHIITLWIVGIRRLLCGMFLSRFWTSCSQTGGQLLLCTRRHASSSQTWTTKWLRGLLCFVLSLCYQ